MSDLFAAAGVLLPAITPGAVGPRIDLFPLTTARALPVSKGLPFPPQPPAGFAYTWRWRVRLPERHGQRLRVLARGRMNTCLVEFEDGFHAVTSRNGLRRARP